MEKPARLKNRPKNRPNRPKNPVDPAIRALLASAPMQANELLVVPVSVAVIG